MMNSSLARRDDAHQMMTHQSGKLRSSFPQGPRETVSGPVPRKCSSEFAKDSTGALTTHQVIREVQIISLQFPTAQVAEEQGASPRAVENQRNGESALSLRNMINWCRANPRVRAQFIRLLGEQCLYSTDPDFMEGFVKVMTSLTRNSMSDADAEDVRGGDINGAYSPNSGDGSVASSSDAVADLFEGQH